MKTSLTQRLLALLLVVCLVIPMAPTLTLPVKAAATDPVIVVAGSDFQASTDEDGAANVKAILNSVKSNGGYDNIDGFLFAGDYEVSYFNDLTHSTNGLNALKGAVNGVYPGLGDSGVYIQGNHDPANTPGLASSGANDKEHYGVFVINEDDLKWHDKGSKEEAQATASNLREYLEDKIEEGYNKPIFVISHIPLHYTMRTSVHGDGRYANYVFNELNYAAKIGLNIIFLFGHHHSNSWLDSQGGSAVFYGKGDKINIPQSSSTNYREETLNFTYMNAGFVGYYDTTNSGVESELTMSVFEISGNVVKISRYTATGVHDVKSKGVKNSAHEETWSVNTRVYTSPQTVVINRVVAGSGTTYTADGNIPNYFNTVVTELVAGKYYRIRNKQSNRMLMGNVLTSTEEPTRALEMVNGDTSVGSLWYYDGTRLRLGDNESGYIMLDHHVAYIGSLDPKVNASAGCVATNIFLNNDGETFTINRGDNAYCLNSFGGASSVKAAGYRADGNNNSGSKWIFYGVSDAEVNMSVVASKTTLTIGQTATMTPVISFEGAGTTDYTLTWSVEDSSIATVAENGFVQTLKQGKTNVVATVTEVNGIAIPKAIQCTIPVKVYPESTGTPAAGVSVSAKGVTDVYAYYLASDCPDGFSAYHSYDITPVGYTEGTEATVSIPVEANINVSRPVYVIDHKQTKLIPADVVNGNVVFTTKHFSAYSVVQLAAEPVTKEGTLVDPILRTVQAGEAPKAGLTYIITDSKLTNASHWMLRSETVTETKDGITHTGLKLEEVARANTSHYWYYDGTHLRFQNEKGKYLQVGYTGEHAGSNMAANVTLTTDESLAAVVESFSSSSASYRFVSPGASNKVYLYHNLSNYAGITTVSNYNNGLWYLNERMEKVYLTVTPTCDTATVGSTVQMYETVEYGSPDHNRYWSTNYDLTWSSTDESIATVTKDGLVTAVSPGQVYLKAQVNTVEGVASNGTEAVYILFTVEDYEVAKNSVTASTHYGNIVSDIVGAEAGKSYVIRFHFGERWYLTENTLLTTSEGYNGLNGREGLELVPYQPLYDSIWYYDGTYLNVGTSPDPTKYMVYDGAKVTTGPDDDTNTPIVVDKRSYPWYPYLVVGDDIDNSRKRLNHYGGLLYNVVSLYSGSNYTTFHEVLAPARQVSLTVSPFQSKVLVGTSQYLSTKVKVDGSRVSDYTIKWASVDNAIATVDANGTVHTVAEGKTYIVGYLTAIEGVELTAPLFVEVEVEVINDELDGSLATDKGLGKYTLPVTELEDGVPYVITSNRAKALDKVLTSNPASSYDDLYHGLQLVPFSEAGCQYVWYLESDSATGKRYLRFGNLTDPNNYLGVVSANKAGLVKKTGDAYDTLTAYNDGESYVPKTSGTRNYLHHHGGPARNAAVAAPTWGEKDEGSRWRFNRICNDLPYTFSVTPENAELNLTQTLTLNTKLVYDNLIKHSSYYKVAYTSSDPTVAAVVHGVITPLKDGKVTIKATLVQATHKGLTHTFEDASVYIPITVHGVQGVTVNNLEGQLPIRANERMKVSAMSKDLADPTLTVTYTDGAARTVPLIGAYMTDKNGNRISTQDVATYENVVINYEGVKATGKFKLHIVKSEKSDYPVYPEPGSVQLDKGTNDTLNFQTSGLTQVELSVNGIPSKKGADVIVMLDTSSSMGNKTVNNEYRLYALTDSLNKLITSLQQVQADGTLMDVRMAVADFNGNYTDEKSPYYVTDYDVVKDKESRRYDTSNAVFTGNNKLDAGAFMNVLDMKENPFYARDYEIKENDVVVGTDRYADKYPTSKQFYLGVGLGTNYDYAFDAVYQLGTAISNANAEAGEERDLYVIFMSDGAPFQYNYFTSYSQSHDWVDWLNGTMDDSQYGPNATKEYYNPRGEHWMAEAIMGDPSETYPVIRKNDYRDYDGDNFIDVAGLGATMYSIGFCLKNDNEIKVETQKALLNRLASSEDSEKYVFFPDSSSDLTGAFNSIFNDIKYAANNAYVLDTMGERFDVKLGNHNYKLSDASNVTFTDNRIEVRNYEIYTITDYQLGNCEVTQIGARKTKDDGSYIYTVSETVTFNADGTQAYSNKINAGQTNILVGGVIRAKYFWYNTNPDPVDLDFNGDGQKDYAQTLPGETFFWFVGNITLTETALSYYVELVGANEGDVDAGIYRTNQSATLHYNNYLGEACDQTAPVPAVPWNNAQVGYGFYLVNKEGVPIVNKETGMTGSFEQSIISVVLTDVTYQDFTTGSTVDLVASKLFPRELLGTYRLFDSEARYKVGLDLGGSGQIQVYTNEVVPLSTYLTGLTTVPLLCGDRDGKPALTTDYATANTVVWFAITVADDAMVFDKTVEQQEGENQYTLTLDGYSTGSVLEFSSDKPADIVLLLDQSASMYTPKGAEVASYDRWTLQNGNNRLTRVPASELDKEKGAHLGYYVAQVRTYNRFVNENGTDWNGNGTTNDTSLAISDWFIVQYVNGIGWVYVRVPDTATPVTVDVANREAYESESGNQYYKTLVSDEDPGEVITAFAYYQSQYGALYDSVNEFVDDMAAASKENGVDHRVAIAGFASPYYDGIQHYNGTGVYLGSDYYLYDTDYMYYGFASSSPTGYTLYVSSDAMYNAMAGDLPDALENNTWSRNVPAGAELVPLDPNRRATGPQVDDYQSGQYFAAYKDESGLATFNQATADIYANALVNVATDKGNVNQTVLNALEAIRTNYLQTSPSAGLDMAEKIFKANRSTDRDQIVVLFTDGVPTMPLSANTGHGESADAGTREQHWSGIAGAAEAINLADEMKNAGVQIYTIGTSGLTANVPIHPTNAKQTPQPTVSTITGESFLQLVSSNYKNVTAVHEVATVQGDNTKLKSSKLKLSQNGNALSSATAAQASADSYAKTSNDGEISIAFGTILESIVAAAPMNETAVLKEVLSQYFQLEDSQEGNLRSNIHVYTAEYLGTDANGKDQFSNTLEPYENAIVEVTKSSDDGPYDIITVTNFDYQGEYVCVYGGKARGRKLVVKVDIIPRKGFWGGNNVPTNEATTGIYTEDMEKYATFPIPQANVSVTPQLVAQNQVVCYKEPTLDTLVDLVQSITVDGVMVHVDDIGNMTPSEPWMDDYADLRWIRNKDGNIKVDDTVPNSVKNDTFAEYGYGFSVSALPKAGKTGTSNDLGEAGSNIDGTPIGTYGVASVYVSPTVDILVPLVTLQDSTARIGEAINRDYLIKNNLVQHDGKNYKWISMSDPYGTEGKSTTVTMGDPNPVIDIGFNLKENSGRFVIDDDPVQVQVYRGKRVPENGITNVAYFEWIPCEPEHESDYTIVDSITNDSYYRHKGDVTSYEFIIHVNKLQEDTVVIDFGKPVDIDVLTNDDLPKDRVLEGVKSGAPTVDSSTTKDPAISNTASTEHSTMTVIKGEGEDKVCYTPVDMQIGSGETFTYEISIPDGTGYCYGSITVIPATAIYYEDNSTFVTYHTGDQLVEWNVGNAELGTQDLDRPGSALAGLAANKIYGRDSSYEKTTTAYSNNGVSWVKASRHSPVDENNDGICDVDNCVKQVRHTWIDDNNDGACDVCRVAGTHHCADSVENHKCIVCGKVVDHTCVDSNTDYLCDICGGVYKHPWRDTDSDGKCNLCNDKHHQCVDSNYDDKCDTCGRYFRHTCVDNKAAKNYCDICGKSMGTHTMSGRATFTFTGTGFDIISLCNNTTGLIMASVYRGTTTEGRPLASYMVDTYWGYKYDKELKEWFIDENSTDAIYQVPVIKADLTKVVTVMDNPNTENVDETVTKDCGYGTYTVELTVAPSFLPGEHGYNETYFYLDAIRIYNPAGKSGELSETVQNAYLADREAWPEYVELRNLLINQGSTTTSKDDSLGIVYIEGDVNTNQIATYKAYGPNNEVYLKPGASIAFKLDDQLNQKLAAVHVGVRSFEGTSVVRATAGTSGQEKTKIMYRQVGTTDMYYDISYRDSSGTVHIGGKVIVITNEGTNTIAITNIKVTHTSAPTRKAASYFMMSKPIADIALDILNAEELAESPVVTPKRPALSFNGMVCYNVFFSAENLGDLTAEDLGLAVFSTEDTEGTVETAREVIYGATEIDGLYMVATGGVHAKNLGDRQYFRAFAKKADGTIVYSKMVSYSAVDYAMNVLAKSEDTNLKQLVVAMLNYGAEAQKFFGYNTDNLMTKDLTADHQALLAGFNASSLNTVGKLDASKIGSFASNGGFAKKSPAISFKGAFEINYFFTPSNAVDGDMKLYFWNEDTYNSVSQLTAENADKVVTMTEENGTYTACSDEIAAKYLDKTVFAAAVYESNGTTYCSGVLPYSIAAYCQKPPATVQDLATAAAIYGCTAKQYFGV